VPGPAAAAARMRSTGAQNVHEIRKQQSRRKTGHYALICNIPGHYMSGMRADLTVT
jgi:Sulfocyanin (SoxE) domain